MTDGLSRRSVPHTLHGIVEFTSTARVLVWASMLLDIAANCRYFRLPVWKLSRFESGLFGDVDIWAVKTHSHTPCTEIVQRSHKNGILVRSVLLPESRS